jgi:hypothetical protein
VDFDEIRRKQAAAAQAALDGDKNAFRGALINIGKVAEYIKTKTKPEFSFKITDDSEARRALTSA